VKTARVYLHNIKSEEWAEMAHALDLSNEMRARYLEFGEYASLELELDEELRVVGGRVVSRKETTERR